MCFTRRGLAVCEDGSIVAVEDIFDNGLGGSVVHLILGHVGLKNFVENVHFSLKDKRTKN